MYWRGEWKSDLRYWKGLFCESSQFIIEHDSESRKYTQITPPYPTECDGTRVPEKEVQYIFEAYGVIERVRYD